MVTSSNDYHRKPDLMKILNPGFFILSEIIAIIFQSTFCEHMKTRHSDGLEVVWGNFCSNSMLQSKFGSRLFSHLTKNGLESEGIAER